LIILNNRLGFIFFKLRVIFRFDTTIFRLSYLKKNMSINTFEYIDNELDNWN